MTVLDANNSLFEWIRSNHSFEIDRDIKKVVKIFEDETEMISVKMITFYLQIRAGPHGRIWLRASQMFRSRRLSRALCIATSPIMLHFHRTMSINHPRIDCTVCTSVYRRVPAP